MYYPKNKSHALRAALFAMLAVAICTALVAQGDGKKDLQYVRSDTAACETARDMLTNMDREHFSITDAHMRRDGLLIVMRKDKSVLLPYTAMKSVSSQLQSFTALRAYVEVQMDDKRLGTVKINYDYYTAVGRESARVFALTLNKLATDAKAGKSFLCTDDPAERTASLEEFTQKTAAWRAMTPKPADSDAVYKFRLLAEDAVKQEDLAGAARYYQEGVDAEPTWAQGWFNVALVYAQMKRYNEAAFSMKHYVVLLPGADDVRGAKDNIILWEAKAEESVAANPKTPAK